MPGGETNRENMQEIIVIQPTDRVPWEFREK